MNKILKFFCILKNFAEIQIFLSYDKLISLYMNNN